MPSERVQRQIGLLLDEAEQAITDLDWKVVSDRVQAVLALDPDNPDEIARAHQAERALFEGVVALEGSISGEHGIGFSKAPYLSLELSPEEIALLKRVKLAFDPNGILNPGKIFPDEAS